VGPGSGAGGGTEVVVERVQIVRTKNLVVVVTQRHCRQR
jgi:hypothetical protein